MKQGGKDGALEKHIVGSATHRLKERQIFSGVGCQGSLIRWPGRLDCNERPGDAGAPDLSALAGIHRLLFANALASPPYARPSWLVRESPA